jgi:hypothetical protein
MRIAVIGLDLAKNVFQVHGIDDPGQGHGGIDFHSGARSIIVHTFFADLPHF